MSKDFPCLDCDCYDHDYESCTMPDCDRSFACSLESSDDEEYDNTDDNDLCEVISHMLREMDERPD